MGTAGRVVKENFLSILLAAGCFVLGVLLFQEHQVAEIARKEIETSKRGLVSAHGVLAEALAEEPLTLERQQAAVEKLRIMQEEIEFLSALDREDETKRALWDDLRGFYDSVEWFLSRDLIRHYAEVPRGEGIVLRGNDKSKAKFLRRGSEAVYQAMEEDAAPDLPAGLYDAWGDLFEKEFHGKTREDLFRQGDNLRNFWGE